MLYVFPAGLTARAAKAYERSYPDPVVVAAGDPVTPDPERTAQTDMLGWTWCRGPDGREGWVPESWIDHRPEGPRMRRAFSALELSLRPGEQIALELSESGWVLGRKADGERGWAPDAVLVLEAPGPANDGQKP